MKLSFASFLSRVQAKRADPLPVGNPDLITGLQREALEQHNRDCAQALRDYEAEEVPVAVMERIPLSLVR